MFMQKELTIHMLIERSFHYFEKVSLLAVDKNYCSFAKLNNSFSLQY